MIEGTLGEMPVMRSEMLGGVTHFVTMRGARDAGDAWDGLSMCHYVGDSEERVAQARRKVAEALGISANHILMPRQVHGTEVVVADKEMEGLASKIAVTEADAIVTNLKGYCIGVSTADCVPIIICDERRGVVAAVHAGWRGVVADIATKTIESMRERFGCEAADMTAVIGPCIHEEAFEVGEEVAQQFDAQFVVRQPGCKPHVSLTAAVERQLRTASITRIDNSAPCTYTHHDKFFSARRLGIHSGRIATCVML